MTPPSLASTQHFRASRALRELRAGIPLVITSGEKGWLVMAGEHAAEAVSPLYNEVTRKPELLITAARARSLGYGVNSDAFAVSLADDVTAQVHALIYRQPGKVPELHPIKDDWLLDWMKLASLLPTLLSAEIREGQDPKEWAEERQVMTLEKQTIQSYMDGRKFPLQKLAETRVPLAGAEDTRVVAFRSYFGGPEHLAVLIGNAEKNHAPLARIHSSCLTGDVLASLRCDCGTQLEEAISAMASEGAGVLLYLQQEGRGIGLASKLRAYMLQDTGMDTLDANEALGFEADERDFTLAAQMLETLGISTVRLMTNNPVKVSELVRQGIEVAARVPIRIQSNPHNARYLDTKAKRAGHIF